tara:strand:+ start:2673 stop:3494 length:822 start_codon:yes stop_codon:yes gene_type:complete
MKRDVGRFDRNTGEILEREPPFVKAYAEHITRVKGVTKMQTEVLWLLLSRMNFDNSVVIYRSTRNKFIDENKTSSNVFSNCVSSLAKAGFLDIEGSGQYFINPDYFTRSDWVSTKKMVAKWTFSGDGVEFERSVINEIGEVIIEAEDKPEAPKEMKIKVTKPAAVFVPFADFWEIYPKKVDKKGAEAKWVKLKVTRELFETIKSHLCKAYASTEKQYIPGPGRYLLGEKWNDEIINVSAPKLSFESATPSFERRCDKTSDIFSGNTFDGEINR